ncbi:MAG: RidA family protein [Erysipelotrichaceae bacterium]|nr:RidA family protein [Erysipelotrichaceae bacterium]
MKEVISTTNAPAAIGPNSQGISNSGKLLFISGQIPVDPSTGNIEAVTIEEQAKQSLINLGAILKQANATYDDVVKTTCFIADMNDFAAFNKVYSQYFTNNCPARSCVAVKQLPKNALCEIEAIAII